MTVVPAGSKILVTGGTGYIGAWVIKDAVDRGFKVKAVVRTAAGGEYIVNKLPEYKGKVEYVVVPDIVKEGAYDAIVGDVAGVLHVASPVVWVINHPDDLIKPAVQGTLNILKAVKAHGPNVKRIVITSSCAALYAPLPTEPVGTRVPNTSWNEAAVKATETNGAATNSWDAYQTSKVLAEQAAWKYVETEKPNFELSTVLPGWTFGPSLHPIDTKEKLGTVLGIYFSYLTSPEQPVEATSARQGDYIDVRDTAAHHTLALITPAAAGKRLTSANGTWASQELFDVAAKLGLKAAKGTPGKYAKQDVAFDNSVTKATFPDFKWTSFEASAGDMLKEWAALGHLEKL